VIVGFKSAVRPVSAGPDGLDYLCVVRRLVCPASICPGILLCRRSRAAPTCRTHVGIRRNSRHQMFAASGLLVTQCMVLPRVARVFRRAGVSGLAPMYPVFDWSCFAPDHYGYQRACDLIVGQTSMGQLGHQCSHAPGRPILHLFSSSRRPRR
jgi:hypothetical protein